MQSPPWLTEAVDVDVDAVMELPVGVQAEAAPSHLLVEEATVAEAPVTEAAAVDTVAAATAEAEIAVATVEVAIGAEVAVTNVAAVAVVADGHLRRFTRLPLELPPFPMPKSRPSRMLGRRPASRPSSQ